MLRSTAGIRNNLTEVPKITKLLEEMLSSWKLNDVEPETTGLVSMRQVRYPRAI